MKSYASCDRLTFNYGKHATLLKTEMLSIRQRQGKVVEVYDGRRWPVVRCGNVFLTAGDTTRKVTRTVVTATLLSEKKSRPSKFTVAVSNTRGHVQAFLEDSDNVLTALDSCEADEKCLMLIKRPRQSAKKMLRSHSLANLSVSDSNIDRDFNTLLSHVHQPVACTPSNQNLPSHNNNVSLDSSNSYSSALFRNDLRSAEREFVNRNDQKQLPRFHQHPPSNCEHLLTVDTNRYRAVRESRKFVAPCELRCSPIFEDDIEINNNRGSMKHNGHCGMSLSDHCCLPDEYFGSNGALRDKVLGDHRSPKKGTVPRNDYWYTSHAEMPHNHCRYAGVDCRQQPESEKAVRSHSLGNLSTNVPSSLVNQKKADSLLNLSTPVSSYSPDETASTSSVASQGQPPRTRAPKPGRHHFTFRSANSPDRQLLSPKYCFSVNRGGRLPITRQNFSPNVPSNGRCSAAEANRSIFSDELSWKRFCASPARRYHDLPVQSCKHPPNSQTAPAISMACCANNAGHVSIDNALAPVKPKRNLPHVSLQETSERVKRITEMMKSRARSMSSSTSAENSPHPSVSLTNAICDPESCKATADGVPDREVFSIFHTPDGGGSGVVLTHHEPVGESLRKDVGMVTEKRGADTLTLFTHTSDCDQQSESGCTHVTAQSHSSDSGYATNTEMEAEVSCDGKCSLQSDIPSMYISRHQDGAVVDDFRRCGTVQCKLLTGSVSPVTATRRPAAACSSLAGGVASVMQGQRLRRAADDMPVRFKPHGKQGVHVVSDECPEHQPIDNSSTIRHTSHHFESIHPQYPPNKGSMILGTGGGQLPIGRNGLSAAVGTVKCSTLLTANGAAVCRESFCPAESQHDDSVVYAQASLEHFTPVCVGYGHEQFLRSPYHNRFQLFKGSGFTDRTNKSSCDRGGVGRISTFTVQDENTYQDTPCMASVDSLKNRNALFKMQRTGEDYDLTDISVLGRRVTDENGSQQISFDNAINKSCSGISRHDDGSDVTASYRHHQQPTFFQLSQQHEMLALRLSLPPGLYTGQAFSLTTQQVTLPATDHNSSRVRSAHGPTANIGGPNSAFRKVMPERCLGNVVVELTSVAHVEKMCAGMWVMGDMQMGDILLELNGCRIIGWDMPSVQHLLDSVCGNVCLSVVRKKKQFSDKEVMIKFSDKEVCDKRHVLEGDIKRLEGEMRHLAVELAEKNSRIMELSTMLPSRLAMDSDDDDDDGVGNVVNTGCDSAAFVIDDNEFVV